MESPGKLLIVINELTEDMPLADIEYNYISKN